MATLGLALFLAAAPALSSAALIVDRGLPNSNLNNAAGANRSNVAWDFNPAADYVAGDTFSLPSLPAAFGWQIDQIRIWSIAGAPDGSFALGDRYDMVSLFLGADGAPGTTISRVKTAGLSGNTTDNADVVVTPVQYATSADYQGSSGSFIQIWQIDFFNLGLLAPGAYLFGADGAGVGDTTPNWFNHASNAALSGTPQDGSDDQYYWFAGNAAGPILELGGAVDSDGFGWDKSSDINIQVWATRVSVPEPGTLALAGLALLGALALRKSGRRIDPASPGRA